MLKKPNIIYVVPLRHIKEVVQDGKDYKEFIMAHEIDNIYMTPGSSIVVEDSVKKSTEKVTF